MLDSIALSPSFLCIDHSRNEHADYSNDKNVGLYSSDEGCYWIIDWVVACSACFYEAAHCLSGNCDYTVRAEEYVPDKCEEEECNKE